MAETKETVVRLDDTGTLHIAEDVVASIVALAAMDTEGVVALSGAAGIPDLPKKTHAKGVRLTIQEQTVGVDVAVLIRYGQPIVQVCAKLQERIANAIETMTGLTAGKIHVHVIGVSFEGETKAK